MKNYEWFKNVIRSSTLLILLASEFLKYEVLFGHGAVELIHIYARRSIDIAVIITLGNNIIAYRVMKTDEFFTNIMESKNKTVMHDTNPIADVRTKAFQAQDYFHVPVRWHSRCQCGLSPWTTHHSSILFPRQHQQFLFQNRQNMCKAM